MKNFIVFNKNSGEILKSGVAPDSKTAMMQSGDGYDVLFDSGSDEGHYVDLSDYTVKEKLDSAATLTNYTLSNLPVPCKVSMYGPTSAHTHIKQGDVDLEADVPGEYTVRVIPDDPKYRIAEFEVKF